MTKLSRQGMAELMIELVDRLPVGVRIVNSAGAIQYENNHMRELWDDAEYATAIRDAAARIAQQVFERGSESSRRVVLAKAERTEWVTLEAFALRATARSHRLSGVAIVATRCAGAELQRRTHRRHDVRRDFLLSRREAEVAQILASGASNATVAAQLGISVHTAKRHTERILSKLGVRSRSAAAAVIARTILAPRE